MKKTGSKIQVVMSESSALEIIKKGKFVKDTLYHII